MEHVEYVYTVGMTDEELDDHLRAGDVGVLSLADGDDAYAVPVGYHYDGESLVVRLGDSGDSTKMDFLDATQTATLVVYETGPSEAVGTETSSWSILVRGSLREADPMDDAAVNEAYGSIRLFDEDVAETDVVLYELEMAAVTGRRTA